MKKVSVWAWEWPKGELCYWAEPTQERLFKGNKPSPEAKAVKCWLVAKKVTKRSKQVK